MPRLWPVVLCAVIPDGATVELRAMDKHDERAFFALRERNKDWLKPWEPTNPDGRPASMTYRQVLGDQRAKAKDGRLLPFAITVDAVFAGQINISGIERGALRSCSAGYWIGREFAGRQVTPTALAMAGDYAFGPMGLHRLEVNIRPENTNSLAVVAKLGLRDEGVRERFLHIDGAWRDHRSFAVTRDELQGETLLTRLNHQQHRSRPRHTEHAPRE